MPAFTLATASATRSGVVHLTPEGAPQSWCGRRADHPAPGPIRLGAICRRCWASAPAEGRLVFEAAAMPGDGGPAPAGMRSHRGLSRAPERAHLNKGGDWGKRAGGDGPDVAAETEQTTAARHV